MKKRVGIILDSLSVSKYIHDLVKLSKDAKNYEISTIVINDTNDKKKNFILDIFNFIKQRGLKKFISSAIFKFVSKFETLVLRRSNKFAEFYKSFKLVEDNFEIIKVNPSISKNGLIYRYNQKDINSIKKANLNLLIRAGSGILKGDILNVCPNGILSFHHADNSINRGSLPGFWEVYEKNPRTGFVIQRLKDELDNGDVLFKGFISTSWLYSLNFLRLYEVANPFLNYVIDNVTSDHSKLIVKNKTPYSYPLYTTPTLLQTLKYLLNTSFILFNKIFRKLLNKSYRWGVAYQFTDNWKDVTMWRSKKIANPNNRYLADPFLIKKGGAHYCFVEDYDFKTKKGSISAYKISKDGYEDLGIVLQEEFHLSYPFLFEYENEIYMCPETNEKKEIRIYKCVEFPGKWVFHKTLMSNVSAADTNIFKFNGKWWLFTNFDKSTVRDHNSQLYIYHNTNPVSHDWVAHEANPLIFDPLIARNGGMICDGKEIYRVFQRQDFDMYGAASGIAKIKILTTSQYEEEVYAEIEPRFFKEIKGTHTYNFNNGLLVFDYVKFSKI